MAKNKNVVVIEWIGYDLVFNENTYKIISCNVASEIGNLEYLKGSREENKHISKCETITGQEIRQLKEDGIKIVITHSD